ncbi:uncharacterized protein LOC142170365 [Nicotiana tabacum]|uniref:Uncharacterized protein LOC142170365 n=1 Tax=Nicotiana tabacum TaxID=4097 RepID=A0AC58STU4_TOBAC
MSRGIDNNNRRKKKAEDDEVEELLRAAEDDVFLKLCLNSHMARGSSTQFIDPDLDQPLKSSLPAYSSSANQLVAEENEEDDDEVEKVIKWAIDAARLDPSPPSDTDEDENSEDDVS